MNDEIQNFTEEYLDKVDDLLVVLIKASEIMTDNLDEDYTYIGEDLPVEVFLEKMVSLFDQAFVFASNVLDGLDFIDGQEYYDRTAMIAYDIMVGIIMQRSMLETVRERNGLI